MKKNKALIAAAVAIAAGIALAGCTSQATTVSDNLSQQADSFKIDRDIVFYNGITDKYILEIKGLCSVDQGSKQVAVTCKIGPNTFIKDFMALSNNVTYVANQTTPSKSNPYFYKITLKPTFPDFDIQTH